MVSYCDPAHLSFLAASDAARRFSLSPNGHSWNASPVYWETSKWHELFMNDSVGTINDINTQVSWVQSCCVCRSGAREWTGMHDEQGTCNVSQWDFVPVRSHKADISYSLSLCETKLNYRRATKHALFDEAKRASACMQRESFITIMRGENNQQVCAYLDLIISLVCLMRTASGKSSQGHLRRVTIIWREGGREGERGEGRGCVYS